MKNLAPEIIRKRHLVEGYFTVDVTKDSLKEFLLDLAKHLNLRVYGEPVIFQPASGMGKDENAGFDAFLPLIDSGISAYIWSKPKFFSVILYTCKDFDTEAAVRFIVDRFQVMTETAEMIF